MASLTVTKKDVKIDECRARRAAFLEARRQQVRDLRNNKDTKKVVVHAAKYKKKEVVVPLVQHVRNLGNKIKKVVAPAPKKKEPLVSAHVSVINFGFDQGFLDMYKIVEIIKEGGFGTVFKVKSLIDPHCPLMAVKVMQKSEMSKQMVVNLKREVKIMSALKKNANTVRFYGAYEDESFVFILMELIEGKEMSHQPEMRGDYSCDESTAKRWMRQLLTALESLHALHIVHRDIKLDNVMFDKSGSLKLIDFGLSDYVRPGERLSRVVGTLRYIAPEVFENSAGLECDLFSVGALLHLLLIGKFPFPDGNGLDSDSWKPDPKFGPNYDDEAMWGLISYEAREFLKGLLQPDPRQRMTASEALAHKWLSYF